MIKNLVIGFVATSLVAGSVFAQARPAARAEVREREEAREGRVEEGRPRISREALDRVRRGSEALPEASGVAERAGREEAARTEVRDEAVAGRAREALEAREAAAPAPAAREAAPAARERAPRRGTVVRESSPRVAPATMAREALALRRLNQVFGEARGQEIQTAITSAGESHYPTLRRFALDLANKVQRQGFDAEVAKQLILDNAKSPEKLEGQLVLGEGSSRACLNMANDAIKNLGEFVRGGEIEGRDPVTYLEGMAKRAAEKFSQTNDEGAARICALFAQGCFKTADAIMAACRNRVAAAH